MPVTVNEVELNTTVNETASNKSAAGKDSGGKGGGSMSEEEKEELIQECLDRVTALIESLKER